MAKFAARLPCWFGGRFFFMLSGFVIAHAYGAKLANGKLRFGEFVLLRFIRLYPLMILGAIIAAAALLFDAGADNEPGNAATVFSALPFNSLGLPTWFYTNNPFDPNFPVWSLFFEITANFAFALCVTRLSLGVLSYLTAFCGALLLGLIIGTNDFARVGTNWPTIALGLIRVAFPFCAGVLLHRLQHIGRLPVPSLHFGALVISLLLVLCLPISYNRYIEVTYLVGAIFVAFPFIIAAGAASELTPRVLPFVAFSGFVSYPLYVLHVPLLLWFDRLTPLVEQPGLVRLLSALTITIGLSWLVGVFYDRPVRRWLAGRRSGTQTKVTQH